MAVTPSFEERTWSSPTRWERRKLGLSSWAAKNASNWPDCNLEAASRQSSKICRPTWIEQHPSREASPPAAATVWSARRSKRAALGEASRANRPAFRN